MYIYINNKSLATKAALLYYCFSRKNIETKELRARQVFMHRFLRNSVKYLVKPCCRGSLKRKLLFDTPEAESCCAKYV